MDKVSKRGRRAKSASSRSAAEPPAPLARVPINGGDIEATAMDSRVWISVRRVVQALGMNLAGQLEKLRAKPWATVRFIHTVGADGKIRRTACIDLDALPMWLATIEPSRVREELRPKLELYQKTAARVLRDHFFGRPELPAPPIEAPPAAPALPAAAASLPLRRIRAADRVLEFVEQDIAMLERLEAPVAKQELPPRWATKPPILLQLRSGISHGLAWVHDALKATSGPADGVTAERWKALAARWRRLTVSNMRFL